MAGVLALEEEMLPARQAAERTSLTKQGNGMRRTR